MGCVCFRERGTYAWYLDLSLFEVCGRLVEVVGGMMMS